MAVGADAKEEISGAASKVPAKKNYFVPAQMLLPNLPTHYTHQGILMNRHGDTLGG